MRRDRGSATIWLLGLVALIGLATTAGVVHGSAVVARHRAETAADLAALAAAVRVSLGESDACGAASTIAHRNGAELTGCVVSGADVEIAVARPVSLGRLGLRTAAARARAGPAERLSAPP